MIEFCENKEIQGAVSMQIGTMKYPPFMVNTIGKSPRFV